MNQINERIENINKIFKTLELQGVETNTPLLYGYFFFDKNKEKLLKLGDELQREGYVIVRLEINEEKEYLLHMEKTETHSRETLLKRLLEFDELSENSKIELFDGWDIGNSDPAKPLISKERFIKLLENKTNEQLYQFAIELLENQIYDNSILVFDKCIANNFETENSLYKQL